MKKILLFLALYICAQSAWAQFPITMSGYPLVYTGWTYGAGSTGIGPSAVDSEFKLTSNVTSEANYLYYNTAINMAAYCTWQADFDFQVISSSSGVADGLSFWFLSNPPSTAATGSAIGLPPYPNGLILILDTYDNNSPPTNTPLETLLGYNGTTYQYVEGATAGLVAPVNSLQYFITDGSWHHVKVTYNMGTVNVYFNYSTTASLSGTYNLSGVTGYFGFSASTGAVYSTQRVKAVNIVAGSCLTPANNGPICEGDTLKLFAYGDSTGATYAWSNPVSGYTSTNQNPVIPFATMADTGTYRVIKNGLDTAYTHVVIKPKPVVVAANNSVICSGSDLTFTATPDSTGETFSWTGPNAYTSAVENPVITGATQVDTGTYTVIANLNGCLDTSTTHVSIIYVAVPTASNNTPICAGDSIVLTSADAATGVTFNWAGPLGYTSAVQNPVIHNATAAMSGTYTVTAANGICSQTATTVVTVNIIPAIPTIAVSPGQPVCSGTTVNLTASSTAGSTYQWNASNGYTSTVQNPVLTNVATSATATYSVAATLNGCTSDTVHLGVIVDSTPEVPTVSNTSPVCTGFDINFTGYTATAGATYHWSGPPPFSSTLQDPTITNATTVESGTYTLTVTLVTPNLPAGCSSSATTNVVVNQTPGMPTVSNNGPVCEGGLLVLSSVATPGSGTYYWTGPNSFTSAVEYPQINNVSLAANGVYSVYEVLNGCVSPTASTTVVINHTPADPVAASNSPVCQGDTLRLYAADTSIGVAYAWSGPSGFTSTDQNTYVANPPVGNSQLYLVTVALGNCSSTSTVSVNVTPTPALTASNNGPICSGDTLRLFATSDAVVTYHWAAPYPFGFSDSTAQNPVRFPTQLEYAGVYTVTVTTSGATGGCKATVLDTVVINGAPAPTWVNWLTYCQYYNAPPLQAVDATNVLWYPSAAAGGVGTATPPVPATNVTGVFYYYLNETVNGCPSPIDSIQVTINPKPVVTVAPTPAYICPHDSVTLVATDVDPLDVYHWYPSVFLNDTLNSSTVVHPITNQDYMVVVQNRFGCTDTALASVIVYPAGVLFFSVGDSVILHPGETFHIEPTTNCTMINWFPPYGLSADNISDPVASPGTNTMYVATGTTEYGCVVKDSIYFHVSDETIYGVPNAFTPGNGTNTIFKLLEEGQGTLNYFRIYDRWGVLVFESNNVANGWDGTYKGQQQPQGVYVYDIQAVSAKTGKIVSLTGNVTLLR